VPTSTPLPEPLATPEPDRLAMLTGTPPPAIRDPQETEAEPTPIIAPTAPPVVARPQPDRAASAYQPEKEQNRISGRITNKGAPSVDAVGTPLGKYRKTVIDAIGSRWYYYTNAKLDLISIGTAQVQAEVDAEGKLKNLKLVSNSANEAFANICLQSFQEAQIPPIPPDLVQTLPDGRLLVEISFNMTPPRTY
jgi:outer membrane biosynthesis protein TonB